MRLPLILSLAVFSTPVMAEVPKVVTDIPAVHALVSQVMGDLGQPVLLLEKGANAHDFQLRPSQAQALSGADLVVWIGPEMTPWLDRTLRGLALKGDVVGLLAAEGTFRRDFGDTGGHDHDDHATESHAGHDDLAKADDHGKDAHAGHDDAGDAHAHDGVDPHVWLDPANARHWVSLIAAELAQHDAANAATYAANADAAARAITALDATIATRLAPVQGKPFVVFHDAYGYFTTHYGLTMADSISLGDAAAPGAARVQAVRDLLRDGKAVCVFPEAQHDPRLVETVVEGTNVRVGATLDPSGSTLDAGPGLYAALLTGLADGLVDCLSR